MDSKEVTILIVDDDAIDVQTIERTLRALRITNPIVSASDGVEAFELLNGQHKRIDSPVIICLDMNMPRMNGLEFLQLVRAESSLGKPTIFVFASSEYEKDPWRPFQHLFSGYIDKGNLSVSLKQLATKEPDVNTLDVHNDSLED